MLSADRNNGLTGHNARSGWPLSGGMTTCERFSPPALQAERLERQSCHPSADRTRARGSHPPAKRTRRCRVPTPGEALRRPLSCNCGRPALDPLQGTADECARSASRHAGGRNAPAPLPLSGGRAYARQSRFACADEGGWRVHPNAADNLSRFWIGKSLVERTPKGIRKAGAQRSAFDQSVGETRQGGQARAMLRHYPATSPHACNSGASGAGAATSHQRGAALDPKGAA